MQKTDCKDCLFFHGESCRLPVYKEHCNRLEAKRKKMHTLTLRETREVMDKLT